MADVIDLNAHRREPWNSGPAQCLSCKYAWVAAAPVGTVALECPSCALTTGVFAYLCCTAYPQYVCACGEKVFAIDTQGPYCLRCGLRADTGLTLGPPPAA